jgi:hypothetical protein
MTDGNNRTAEDFLTTAEELRKNAVALKALRERARADFNDPKYAPILDSLLQSEPTSTRELIEKFSTDVKETISEQIRSTSRTIGNYCFKLAIFLAGIALLVAGSLLFARFAGGPPKEVSSSVFPYLSVGLLIVASAAAAAVIFVAFVQSVTSFNTFWGQIERVLQSGVFYFFAGLALLVSAIYATNTHEHPSLTFLIAMLGVAIMLFGTGSQAAGSIASSGAPLLSPSDAMVSSQNPGNPTRVGGSNGGSQSQGGLEQKLKAIQSAVQTGLAKSTDADKAAALAAVAGPTEEAIAALKDGSSPVPRGSASDWSPVKANAAIAGGAAVLTALFALGVIHYRSEIGRVFSDFDDYARLQIDTCASRQSDCSDVQGNEERLGTPEQAFKLEDYSIQAELGDGTPLYVRAVNRKLTILLFSKDIQEKARIRLTATRTSDCGTVYRNKLDVSFRVDNLFKSSQPTTTPPPGEKAAKPDNNECIGSVGMKSCPLHRFEKDRSNRERSAFYALTFLSDVTDKDSSPVCEKQKENSLRIAAAEKVIAGTNPTQTPLGRPRPELPATTISKDDLDLR